MDIPRDIPARPREALDNTAPEDIAHRHDDHGRRGGRALCHVRPGGADNDEHVHVRPQQVGDLVAVALRLSLRPAVLDDDVLPLDIAQLPEARPESVEVLPVLSRRVDKDDSYSGNLPRPLRPSGQRPSEATGQRGQQEAAAVHAGTVGRVNR
jgi:hypothetical protein